ncbi:MAG: hypothetical protein A3C64_02140 [Candidatus Yanofskybacteria bacterium RIFCSPHIGHO2_02_FULL_41_12]|nr:MAG: hypothetical protein A3C64_02140 [Candidatus Yanofskybacteria bacterium RIFCSPHIGHO2_02_FULL_41_12]OGN21728.1 MAG: hypothetical protein A3B00_02710 [Candidatus Yanofskybacteria bacterium RIFCSPLOWO2_01_FULL_41_33]
MEVYIGLTSNLKKKLETHNCGGKKFTTRKMGEWILTYAEAYRTKLDAVIREKRLKNHGNAKIELFKRINNSLLDAKTGEGRS